MIEINRLSWKLPKDEQNYYISLLRDLRDDEILSIILPTGMKDCWMNCAAVLSNLSDDRFIRFLPNIFEWFKDINWPGVDIIENRILKLPINSVKNVFSEIIDKAIRENDIQWEENLRIAYDDYIEHFM